MNRTRTVRSARWSAAAGTTALGLLVMTSGTAAAAVPAQAQSCLLCRSAASTAVSTGVSTVAATPTPSPTAGSLLGTVTGVVSSTLTGAGSAVASTVTGAGGVVAGTVKGVGGALGGSSADPGPLGGVTDAVGGAVSGLAGTLGDTVTGVTSTLSGTLGGLSGSAGGALGGVTGKPPATGGQPAVTTPGQLGGPAGTAPRSGPEPNRLPYAAGRSSATRVSTSALGDRLVPQGVRQLDLGASAHGASAPSEAGSPTFTHLDVSTRPVSAWAAIVAITLICAVGAGNLVAVRRLAVIRASQAAHSRT